MSTFPTPILFIIFNRPDTTRLVFEEIRKVKPQHLYIAADGPRPDNPDDLIKCKMAREVIKIDWDCDVNYLYSDINQGCGKGPANAIDWFFEHVEEGIIIEDDCLPHQDFFYYCHELLEKYRSEKKISSIAGSNFQAGKNRGDHSYYFSIHNRIWGWATWKRVWKSYDYYLNNINGEEINEIINKFFSNKNEQNYWLRVFENSKTHQTNNSAWDFQFMFLQWKLNTLSITPNNNLVSNIGYGDDATHTAWGKDNPNLNIPTKSILPLKHPTSINRDLKADKYYFHNYIKPGLNIFQRITKKTKKILYGK